MSLSGGLAKGALLTLLVSGCGAAAAGPSRTAQAPGGQQPAQPAVDAPRTTQATQPVQAAPGQPVADQDPLHARVDALVTEVSPHVLADRRYIHQHPELSNREFETSKYVARRLREIGAEVRAPIAKTGVVGVVRGGKPGPTVALRAELDALPIEEDDDLPFKSTRKGVMHACGHDAHMAMLLGVAELFTKMKADLPGTVELVFQPGEEGPPPGELDGAVQMIRDGVLTTAPKPRVMLGAHVVTTLETGQIGYRAGGLLASDDQINIVVHGKQTHSSTPWTGVDAIVVASQIVLGLQTIASRQMEVTKAPVVITVTTIGGGGENVVAEKVAMTVTLRTFDPEMRKDAKMRIKRTAASIAAAAGATVDAVENAEMAAPGVYNDPTLMARLLPTLRRVAGEKNVVELPPQTYADDFSFYQEKIPGVLVVLGARKPGGSLDEYAPNHSQHFKIDEASLDVGVRTLANMTVDYLLGAR